MAEPLVCYYCVMKEEAVGVRVEFNKDRIGVFGMVSSEDRKEALRGELMLTANYILRVLALSKKTTIRQEYIRDLSAGISNLDEMINSYITTYEMTYKVSNVVYNYKLLAKSDRSFTFTIPYTQNGHTTQFKPKGFGLLGKNIEVMAMFASVLWIDFLKTKYMNADKIRNIIDAVVKEAIQFAFERNCNISTRDEWNFTESIAKKYL